MQFFKKTVNAIKSVEFFGENNLFQKLNNSTFGIFHNNVKKMDIPTDDFKLPIITIIGNESSGKSSLISNILKCDIFPINRNRCTKCPIKIELINSAEELYLISFKGSSFKVQKKEEILEMVTKLMSDINDIIEDELHILFQNPNVITSTYYDLPGIIEYPDNLRLKSKEIVNKYIIRENTLIICVIPASTPRLTSNQALGLIIDAKKTKDCIIALSMIDLLHDDDIEVFINRILMKSDEVNELDIHNIIGLSNNASIDEKKWFSENILAYITDNDIKKEIIAKITLENLIKSVDMMYDNYIKLNWKEKAITTAQDKIKLLKTQYKEMGDENLDITEVYNFIREQMKLNEIFSETNINEIINNCCYEELEYYYDNGYLNCNNDLQEVVDNYEVFKNQIKNNIKLKLDSVYNIDCDYKLERFTYLKEFIYVQWINIFNKECEHLDEWFNSSIKKLKYELINALQIKYLYAKISVNFKRHILMKLNEIKVKNRELLKENETWITKRSMIQNEIKKYDDCKRVLMNL
jgi:hypothetical protein